MLKTIKYNVIVLLVLLVLIEGVLWFFPVSDPYENAKKNMFYPTIGNMYIESQFDRNMNLQFATEDGLLGFENYKEPTSFTINNYGFRGDELKMPKPTNEYRILQAFWDLLRPGDWGTSNTWLLAVRLAVRLAVGLKFLKKVAAIIMAEIPQKGGC